MSFWFLFLKHPLALGVILIIQTILISLIIGLLSQTFWFSYILFLVIVGGILILFIYIISLIFNKIFIQQLSIKFYIVPFILLIRVVFLNKYYNFNNIEIYIKINLFLTKESSLNLIKLYTFPINIVNLFIINYLFFLLIVVVKITNFYQGPLRIKI